MLAIQKYLLANGLEKTVAKFELKTREYENKVLLKYDQLCGPSLMANQEVQECRGLILEKGSWKVMSLAFTKFFNSEEGNAHKIDWNTAHVLEKLDGSCIQVYYDWNENVWYAGTTGTANGEGEVNNKLGTTFNQLFWNTVKEKYGLDGSNLNKGFTYVFELTTPYNIVVKPHGESSASLLTVRNLETLQEVSFDELTAIAESLGIPRVKEYDLSANNVGALLRTFTNMVWHDEGYVVVDANFNRVKIKNPAYVAVHHLKGKTAEHNIIAIVKTNEIEEFAATFPDRKDELYKLKENYDKLVNHLTEAWVELKDYRPKNITPAEKKKYAQSVFEVCAKRNIKHFTGLYFGLNEGKISSVEDFIFNYDDKTLYKML
jgi:T4 RnlA family RNA ligase